MEWNGASLMVPRPAGAAPGDRVLFSIKFEDVEIARETTADPSPPGHNLLAGRLRDVIFKGQTANYIIALPHGIEITASGTPRTMTLRPGEAVVAHWPSRAGACFKG